MTSCSASSRLISIPQEGSKNTLDAPPALSIHRLMYISRRSKQRGYSYFAPYVPVAVRRREAKEMADKMAKKGQVLEPVIIHGTKIATTFWGKEWCDNLEAYSDYSNRLPRGRTYARNRSVIDLKIKSGVISALVQGSSLYKVEITIAPLAAAPWKDFKKRCAGQISSLLDLLQGRLDKGVLTEITRRPGGLFPAPREMKFSCSCPDGASMCKHVAATLYGVGARLDHNPELFFTLRSADMQELITASSNASLTAAPTDDALAPDDLSAIFGIEIDTTAAASPKKTKPKIKANVEPAPIPKDKAKSPARKRVAKKAARKAAPKNK